MTKIKPLTVFTNCTDISDSIKKSKFDVRYISIKDAVEKIKKSSYVVIDTETCPKDLNKDNVINGFIEEHIASGKKVTKTTRTSAEKYYEDLRKEHSVNPHLAKIRLIQVLTDTNDLIVMDSFVENLKPIVQALKNKSAIFQNAKFDIKMLMVNYDYSVGEVWDTMIAHKLIRNAETVAYFESHLANVVKYALGIQLLKGHGADDWRNEITVEMFDYSVEDVQHLINVYKFQCNKLNDTSVLRQESGYFNNTLFDIVSIIEMKFVPVLAKIELKGIKINRKKLLEKLDETAASLSKAIIPFVKDKVNTSSPLQLMNYLEEKTGQDIMSTSKEELTKLAHIPLVAQLLEVKTFQKRLQMISDYINKWSLRAGRIYADFNQMRATDGRMSCREPNMQQIPRVLKKIFYFADKGRVIIKADYPAIEARIMGVIANDAKIISIFKNKKDMHSETGASFLKKPVKDVTEEERRKAKAANFGFMFGMGALTYTRYAYTNYGLIVSLEEAVETRKKYMAEYPGVQRFHNANSQKLKDNYEIVIRTLLGRKMKCDSFTNSNNYPVQGSAVDMIKLATVLFDSHATKQKIDAQIINIVHDEIVVDSSVKDKTKAKKILKEAMETAADYIIQIFPTEVEIEELKN